MKNIWIATLLVLIATSSCFAQAKPNFAVLELFTSEGCSSCPPADELLSKINKESQNQQVYILAYHVDYWDKLGWKDPFSNAAYSKRQYEYASQFHLSSVYTPQLVINGKAEFIGSDEAKIRKALKNNMQIDKASTIEINEATIDKNLVKVKFGAKYEDNHYNVIIALVQKSISSKVERGENGGKTLPHVQVVRDFKVINVDQNQTKTLNLTLPIGFEKANFELIAFIQNHNGAIVNAVSRKL